MEIREDARYSRDYHDPAKRSIANAVQVWFADGSDTGEVAVEYPLGHRRRREEGLPALVSKFRDNLATCFDEQRRQQILTACGDSKMLHAMPVTDFMALFVTEQATVTD